MKLRGCGTAIVTPFKADGSIDDSALRNLVAWQVESKIDFLVPCGTTGETPTLMRDEWLRVIETTIEVVAGRVPIVAGATSNATIGKRPATTSIVVSITRSHSSASASESRSTCRTAPENLLWSSTCHATRLRSALSSIDPSALNGVTIAVPHPRNFMFVPWKFRLFYGKSMLCAWNLAA